MRQQLLVRGELRQRRSRAHRRRRNKAGVRSAGLGLNPHGLRPCPPSLGGHPHRRCSFAKWRSRPTAQWKRSQIQSRCGRQGSTRTPKGKKIQHDKQRSPLMPECQFGCVWQVHQVYGRIASRRAYDAQIMSCVFCITTTYRLRPE